MRNLCESPFICITSITWGQDSAVASPIAFPQKFTTFPQSCYMFVCDTTHPCMQNMVIPPLCAKNV